MRSADCGRAAARVGQATLDALRDGDVAAIEARFDERMRGALPPEKLAAT